MKQQWEKVTITLDNGEQTEAIAPIIISASRSTDIPAFFSEWLFNRIERGYVKWNNPFNRSAPQYISFKNVKLFVFWTKNPAPILPFLEILDKMGINYYFQVTVNDYDNEQFEPNTPKLADKIASFINLSQKIGKEKVIWRFDPLILTNELDINALIVRISSIAGNILSYTNKLVFSFVDINQYAKVQRNMIKEHPEIYNAENISKTEFTNSQKEELAGKLRLMKNFWQKVNPDFKIATCGEDFDLDKYGIEHNRCIDGDLICKLFKEDKQLMDFIGYDDNDLFGSLPDFAKLKDKGQRKACGCIFSKDIGEYNTCRHFCSYCYANSSRNIVEKNSLLIDNMSESLI